MNSPQTNDLAQHEKKLLRDIQGEFLTSEIRNMNYKIEHKDGRTYMFEIRSTSIGIRFMYRGVGGDQQDITHKLPNDVIEDIESQRNMRIENIRDAV